MYYSDADVDREERRRRFFRNLPWLIPVGMVLGVGLFIGIGQLFVWLWRVTLVDIFAIKQISFWQAWGIILISQILFKANMRPTTRTGEWQYRRRRRDGAQSAAPPPDAHATSG